LLGAGLVDIAPHYRYWLKESSCMGTIILIFLLPIAIYFYLFVEPKIKRRYFDTFTKFEDELRADKDLTDQQKLERYEAMLQNNRYTITHKTKTEIIGERKIFSMPIFAIGVGLYVVGALIYLLYFFFIQRPHVLTFQLNNR